MNERKLSVTITGPEGMLGGMATLLRDEGYIVERTAIEALDRVLAAYLVAHPKAFPSKTSVITIAEWLKARGERLPEPSGRVEVLEGLMRETIQLWHEWQTTSDTWESDHDRWAAFSDRVSAWLERARAVVPDRTPKATPKAPPPRKKRPVR